jgi:CheY-like chemotaxis protein
LTFATHPAESGGAPTPIVALTANAFEEDRNACVAAADAKKMAA